MGGGTQKFFPFSNQGLIWKSNQFKALVNFQIKDPFFLVLKFLLKTIENVNTLLQKSGTNFLFILKNGDLSCSLKNILYVVSESVHNISCNLYCLCCISIFLTYANLLHFFSVWFLVIFLICFCSFNENKSTCTIFVSSGKEKKQNKNKKQTNKQKKQPKKTNL